MHVTRKQFIFIAALLAIAVGGYFYWQGKAAPKNKQARSPVQVIKSGIAKQQSIPITVQANGYVTPLQTVEVRPQTQNIVREVHVKEGQEVKTGQLLFTLDQRSDLSNVARAQAQLGTNSAELADAEAALKRNQELLAKNFVSQAVVDTARSKVNALRSTTRADQAAIQSSNVALSNNRITASISGRIGTISVHPGSLAQPAGTPLLTIAQLDPISVAFAVPEQELTHIRASYPNGDAPVRAQLPGGQEVDGKLFFIDNAVDAQTGTIRMKAQFANADRRMWPGTFVNVRLVSRTLPNAVAIPAQAIVTGPVDKFVYVVKADDTVQSRKITVMAIENGLAAVSGVDAGTRIVVEGTQNLRPGGKIREAGAAVAGKGNNEGVGTKKSTP